MTDIRRTVLADRAKFHTSAVLTTANAPPSARRFVVRVEGQASVCCAAARHS
jgi:hypothetical protein